MLKKPNLIEMATERGWVNATHLLRSEGHTDAAEVLDRFQRLRAEGGNESAALARRQVLGANPEVS